MNHIQFQVSAGAIAITWSSQGLLTRLDWYDTPSPLGSNAEPDWYALSRIGIPDSLAELIESLRLYFTRGEPLARLPWHALDTRACTEFQVQVYQALIQIPHGETRTYAWVAKKVGQVSASRAVGQALRKNPFPILIPCHRVVAANTLGGFMGAVDPDQPELRLKKWLIDLEGSYLNPVFSFLAPLPRYRSEERFVAAG